MVRHTLAAGEAMDAKSIPGAKLRFVREHRFGGRVLRVVYVEDLRELTIITVMWKS